MTATKTALIFYPALKGAWKDKLLVPEAAVYVKHHVKEEQSEMFPKAKASSLDMLEPGARLAARKDELTAQVA